MPRRRAARVDGPRASGPAHQSNDRGADVVDRRGGFGEAEADVCRAALGGGDVLATKAVDVVERRLRDRRRQVLVVDGPLAEQHAGVGMVGVHVLDHAVAASEGLIHDPGAIRLGVDPVHPSEPADPADRRDVDAPAREVAVRGVPANGRQPSGDERRRVGLLGHGNWRRDSDEGDAAERQRIAVGAAPLGDEQAAPAVDAEVAGVLGDFGDDEQRAADVVGGVRHHRAERVAGWRDGERAERAGPGFAGHRAGRVGCGGSRQVGADDQGHGGCVGCVVVVLQCDVKQPY